MQSKKVIPKKLVEKFLREKHLAGIVDFLRLIVKDKRNLQSLSDFLHTNNHTLPFSSLPSRVIFHGTRTAQSLLVPQNSMGRGGKLERSAFVYATDNPNYAIFLAILRLKDGSASVDASTKKPVLSVGLDFVNGPSELKDGYVHVLSAEGFEKTKNREYRTRQQAEVLFVISVTPADLTVPIYIQTGQ